MAEIARMLGVSRQRAQVIANTKGFPDPVEKLAMGHLWEVAAIVKWAAKQDPPRRLKPLT